MNKPWFYRFFRPQVIDSLFGESRQSLAPREVTNLLKNLKLKKGASILDAPCGVGRHSLLLAKKGFKVTGIDIASYSLGQCRKEARKTRLQITLKQAELKKLPFPRDSFDLVANLWTSFGYYKISSLCFSVFFTFKISNTISHFFQKNKMIADSMVRL